METWWIALLREQLRDDFADLKGASASITVPLSDRLVSRLLTERLPASARVRKLDMRAHPGDELTLRVQIGLLPAVTMRFAIVQQPQPPRSSVLGLAVVSRGLASLAMRAVQLVDGLPDGVHYDGQRLDIDLEAVLARGDASRLLRQLTRLTVTTADGSIIIHAQGAL